MLDAQQREALRIVETRNDAGFARLHVGQFESPVRADRPVPARRPADHRPGPALYEKTDLSELRAHGRIVRAFNGDYASDGRPTRRLDLQPAYIAVNDLEFDIFAGRGSAASLLVDIDDE